MTPSQAIYASSPLHDGFKAQQSPPHQTFSDPNHLAPEDAFLAHSPPRKQRDAGAHARSNGSVLNGELASARAGKSTRRPRDKERGRSGSRRRKGVWKKLLWVKQPYPDNYTDPPSFLSHLQRNPRLLPYDFWPLVADSTVIVQHICSVAIFLCCFAGIIQQRVSPVAVVNCGSASTLLGYLLWDFWLGRGEAAKALHETNPPAAAAPLDADAWARDPNPASAPAPPPDHPPSSAPPPAPRALSARNQQRLATAKSAVLIYSALLGLSPILKSLTKSTTSDSIWAMSTWLMCINVFFFDYGGGAVGVPFPASLSTNAALMASTVLASRLPSTTHVFSLTLFSIEVFGLFPVFRRHLRQISWRGHLLLTVGLTVGAGAGVGVTMGGRGGEWRAGGVGVVLWGVGTAVGMGGCSWWLIGLQKYKNVVIGPWDPARPVLRGGHWD